MAGWHNDFLWSVIIGMRREIGIEVARTMHDVDDIEMAAGTGFIRVPEKNNVGPEHDTALTWSKFRPVPPHEPRQSGEMLAIVGQLVREGISSGAALALALDIRGDVSQIS